MSYLRSLSAGLLAVCLLMLAPLAARAQGFEELLQKVPDSANALVMIDVENTISAPLAKKEGWGADLERAYVERPIFLPPESKKMVLASALAPDHDFSPLWELAVMELDEPLSMRSIARSEGGYVDSVQGVPAAWTPSDAYFVSLADRVLGVLFPAERQFVSRWVKFAEHNTEVVLSDYLRAASRLTNERVQILLAMDLTDVVNETELVDSLKQNPEFSKTGLVPETAAPVIASIRGAVLRVAVGDDVQGQLRIDFDRDVAPLGKGAGPLVIGALKKIGAELTEVADWKVELKERAILMQGPLSTDDQRRVFSVIEIPSTKFSTLKDETADDNKPTESQIREASMTYYNQVDVLLKDLRRGMKKTQATAAIQERYARKIDRMPILDVDPELLDFGSQVAQGLRSMALAKRQGGIQYGTQTAGMGPTGTTGVTWYSNGYLDYAYANTDRYQAARESAAERASLRKQAMAPAINARIEGWKMIEEAQADIRRRMTEKYQVEF